MARTSPWRRVFVGLTVGAVTLGSGLLVTPASGAAAGSVPPPSKDPFYLPPNPIPNVAPGTILRSRKITVRAVGLSLPVTGYQVLYRSSDAKGKPNAISGTLLLPGDGKPKPGRPLLAYNPANDALGQDCAPSYILRSGVTFEVPMAEEPLEALALAKGWAVMITDNEGTGTPGPHAYTAGHSAGHAVLDGLRAAERLPEAGLSQKSPVGIWGYSGGALASTWAAELQPRYAPELNVKGVAAGGIPVDVGNIGRKIDGGPFSGVLLAASVGLNRAYPEMDLASVLNDKGKQAVAKISSMCQAEYISAYGFRKISEFTTMRDPISLPQFQRVIAVNRLGQQAPTAPYYAYQSVNDELVLYKDVRTLVAKYCAAGTKVDFHPSVLSEHISLTVTGAPGALAWLSDRLAGRPAPTTC